MSTLPYGVTFSLQSHYGLLARLVQVLQIKYTIGIFVCILIYILFPFNEYKIKRQEHSFISSLLIQWIFHNRANLFLGSLRDIFVGLLLHLSHGILALSANAASIRDSLRIINITVHRSCSMRGLGR